MLYCSFWVRFFWLLTQGIDDKIAEMKYCSTLYCFGWCLHGLFNKAHVFTYVEQVAQCSVSSNRVMYNEQGINIMALRSFFLGKCTDLGQAMFGWFCFENREIHVLSVISLHIRSIWETICDAWACWSGWNFGPNSTVYPHSEVGTPPPKNSDLSISWHFKTFQFWLRNTTPLPSHPPTPKFRFKHFLAF